MKGHVETTIPQRQYENIKIHYAFETDAERETAIQNAVSDCIKYNNIVNQKGVEMALNVMHEVTGMTEIVFGSTKWRKVEGEWQYYDEKIQKWIDSDSNALLTVNLK